MWNNKILKVLIGSSLICKSVWKTSKKPALQETLKFQNKRMLSVENCMRHFLNLSPICVKVSSLHILSFLRNNPSKRHDCAGSGRVDSKRNIFRSINHIEEFSSFQAYALLRILYMTVKRRSTIREIDVNYWEQIVSWFTCRLYWTPHSFQISEFG